MGHTNITGGARRRWRRRTSQAEILQRGRKGGVERYHLGPTTVIDLQDGRATRGPKQARLKGQDGE